MALSGQLSDLSLAELIEFFCNQRKTGRLKVAYELTPGFFYFDRGDLVDAKIGSLNGVEAIYYALTLANASFKFSPAFEPARRTIHQPWTQVTLEGLRRLDEGIKPKAPFAEEGVSYLEDPDGANESPETVEFDSESGMPLSLMVDGAASKGKSKMVYAGIAAAIIALVAVAGIPAGWYKGKAAVAAQPAASSPAPEAPAQGENAEAAAQPEQPAADPNSAEAAASINDANALAAKRAREARDRAKMAEAAAAKQALANQPEGQPGSVEAAKKPEAVKSGPKMVTVQVSYDEAGRVTQTSGGDGTAQRIARQKRFPAGKAGTTTVTIPIN
jgi:Domain of unknown function (DUF4388)